MSNFSHRGYEHRTGGYGRRRHKASGFKRKSSGNGFIRYFVIIAAVIAAAALIFIFVKYLGPFVDSFKDTDTEAQPIETADTATPDSPDAPSGSFDIVDSKVFVSEGSGYVMFKGIDDTAVNYSAVLNSVTSPLADDVSVYSMVIPTNTEFGLYPDYRKYSNSQKDNLEKMRSALMDRVTDVDLYGTFDLHKNEYIYYRTDESLTYLGGYYAYREFAQTAGFKPDYIYSTEKLSEKKGNVRRFEGSFIARTTDEKLQPHGNQELFDNADTVDFFKLPVHYNCFSVDLESGDETETDLFTTEKSNSDPLSVFPAKDTALLKIYNVENDNDENLLIIKDHAGEPVIGYLVPAYEEVHVIDTELYKGNINEYIQENDITHVLFISSITDANNSLYCQRLRDLFDNNI